MTAMITEIERLRRELAAAEEELAAWRAVTIDRADELTRLALAIRTAFPALPGHGPALYIAALYSANRPLSFAALDDAIPAKQTDNRNCKATLSTLTCHARTALGRDAIKTHRGYGYSLTPVGRERIRAAIA